MIRKLLLITVTLFSSAHIISASHETDTLTMRIKGMRCEECAHKVGTRLRQIDGVGKLSFDLEKRIINVAYNPAKTCADSIKAPLLGTRYAPSTYSQSDVILRGIGFYMDDMHCDNCAYRITQRLNSMQGIDSLAPHVDKHYVFIRYDANKICKNDIRQALKSLAFTPVNYYTSKDISFAYFSIPKEAATEDTEELVLSMDGVDDACVNARRNTVAITFANKETSLEKIQEELKAAGIEATLPPAHECKENNNQET